MLTFVVIIKATKIKSVNFVQVVPPLASIQPCALNILDHKRKIRIDNNMKNKKGNRKYVVVESLRKLQKPSIFGFQATSKCPRMMKLRLEQKERKNRYYQAIAVVMSRKCVDNFPKT